MTGRGKVVVGVLSTARGEHAGCVGMLREMADQPDDCIVRTVQCDECGEVVGWTPTTREEADRRRPRRRSSSGNVDHATFAS